MKTLANMRKADKRLGDDPTFTRWIATPGRHTGHRTPPAAADAMGTRFPTRVLQPTDMKSLLVSGHSNVKIGRDVRSARFNGYWIYTLSLEERKTCPRVCAHWRTCYGNSMPFAKRIDHTNPDFLPILDAEIEKLVNTRGRKGILIRLHALGDFFSTSYVDFWRDQLRKHPRLALFGYTAYPWHSTIGQRLELMWVEFGDRALIRFSNGGLANRSTVPIAKAEDCPGDAFVCPEQTGQFEACGKCGACWSTTKNVAFVDH